MGVILLVIGLLEQEHLLYGLPSDLGHDCALSTQILKGQAQEIVNDERCGRKKGEEIVPFSVVSDLFPRRDLSAAE